MNYKRIYDNIVAKYKNNPDLIKEFEYYETHHIIPKCMGGTDDEANLVRIPAREHIFLHIILTEIYPTNDKLLYAANCMISMDNTVGKHRKLALAKFSTRILGEIRARYALRVRAAGIICNTNRHGKVIRFQSKCAICFDDNFNVIRIYSPATYCEVDGFYPNSVCRACRTKIKYAGYYWSYEDDFKKSHQDKIDEYKSNRSLGKLPDIDLSYNSLSKRDRLLARPKQVRSEESRKRSSDSLKGKKKAPPKIGKAAVQQKKIETMKKNGTHGGTPRIPVLAPDGKIYDNLTACGKAFNVNRHTIQKWANLHPEKGFKLLPSLDKKREE